MQPRRIPTGEPQVNFVIRKGFVMVRTKDKKARVISIEYRRILKPKVVENGN